MKEQRSPLSKPEASSGFAQRELDKAEKQFESFDEQVKDMTMDRMNMAPKQETEGPQVSQKQIEKSKDVYLKPDKVISSNQKFNERFRSDYEFQKEYVQFIAENKEFIGDNIEVWTRPFGGMPAEFWKVPSNKPVWGPRYLAERIKACYYHRLVMQEGKSGGSDSMGQYYGVMAADTTVQRLDCTPVQDRKSIFMGSSKF